MIKQQLAYAKLNEVLANLQQAKALLVVETITSSRHMRVGMSLWAAHSKAIMANFHDPHLLSEDTLQQLQQLIKMGQCFDMAWQLKHDHEIYHSADRLDLGVQAWIETAEQIDYGATRQHLLRQIDSLLDQYTFLKNKNSPD